MCPVGLRLAQKTMSFDPHQFYFMEGRAKFEKGPPEQQFSYCILRRRLHLLTPVCFEVKRCRERCKKGGGGGGKNFNYVPGKRQRQEPFRAEHKAAL